MTTGIAAFPFSEKPLIFRATTHHDAPQILYVANRGMGDTADISNGAGFNLSYKVHEEEENIAEHHRQLDAAIGKPLVLLRQVHSHTVVDVDEYLAQAGAQPGNTDAVRAALPALAEREADALVTTRTDVALGIYTADCTPLFFMDRVNGVYGAAHVGRKGVENGVALETLKIMASKGSTAADTEVWLGPNICGNCYETGDAVAQEFAQATAQYSKSRVASSGGEEFVTRTRFGGAGIDMRRALAAEMIAAGVRSANIHDADPAIAAQTTARLEREGNANELALNPMCTLENPLLYSYREWTLTHASGSNGRFVSVLLPR
ncbi:MAG: polyphenol oxidase family protein [Bifidobacteriaceae bacterium]|jgi:YfiH family protein|nr:polyphenol oxidase family protein [Bifidobacteriaceae bacterium]